MSSKDARVSPGGLFHSRRTEYSPETQAFLKDLIRESKLSMFQRRKLQESVNKGEPLPLPPNKPVRSVRTEVEENIKYFACPRRRKKDMISESGAYEREQFIPNYSTRNHDLEKKRLQDFMAFGKIITEDKSKVLAKLKAKQHNKDEIDIMIEKDQRYTETLKEIKERLDFLKFMDEKGEKAEYDHVIKQEIAAKMRQLEDMDEGFRIEQRKEYKEIRDRAALKLYGNLS
ncbi:UPF0193 protein EVG1 [Cimex lectularius]|uniref:Uncharacterized protein n=1 Tax=Cimex lectularius TaxID=79782 RepID=A0A8I6RVD7_CIMLE|nr:UPF0193 protein EVG1 [Cimex lectularius]